MRCSVGRRTVVRRHGRDCIGSYIDGPPSVPQDLTLGEKREYDRPASHEDNDETSFSKHPCISFPGLGIDDELELLAGPGSTESYFHKESEQLVSVSATWTDIIAEDPVVQLAAGRVLFRALDRFQTSLASWGMTRWYISSKMDALYREVVRCP